MLNRDAYSSYFEQQILSAGPLDLVCLLYQTAIARVRDARRHLAGGDIPARCAAISKTCDIVGELMAGLDLKAGGALAERLRGLYTYILCRLLDANVQKADEPLAEVLGLLMTLQEGWKQIAEQSKMEPDAPPTLVPAGPQESAAALF